MKFLNEYSVGAPENAKEPGNLWNLSEKTNKFGVEGSAPQTNVIWVQNPWTQFSTTERGTDMPAATLSSTQHPNNEDCGIRDVWAHNLEDEFKTIRQVLKIIIND